MSHEDPWPLPIQIDLYLSPALQAVLTYGRPIQQVGVDPTAVPHLTVSDTVNEYGALGGSATFIGNTVTILLTLTGLTSNPEEAFYEAEDFAIGDLASDPAANFDAFPVIVHP